MLKWLFGAAIGPLKDGLLQAQQQYFNAKNDSDRLKAEENMKYWQGQIDLAVAASANDRWWSVRSLIGYAVVTYIFKIIVWDTVLGLGITRNPGEHVTFVVMTVIAFYFASKTAERIAEIVGGRIGRR